MKSEGILMLSQVALFHGRARSMPEHAYVLQDATFVCLTLVLKQSALAQHTGVANVSDVFYLESFCSHVGIYLVHWS